MTTLVDRGPNLGRIVQNEKNPLLLTSGRRRLIGYVEEAHRDEVGENSLLVVEDPDADLSLLCRIVKVRSFPQQSSIAFRGVSEFVTQVELDVMGQLVDWGLGSVPNGDFNGYDLRGARSNELAVAYGIPETGISLGDLILDRHPSEVRFRLPGELLYRSLFICGAKGSGKTTCLRSLLPKSIEGHESTGSSPAVVILDVEGEFSDEGTPRLFADNGAVVNVQRISTDPGLSTATLSLRLVHPEDFANFAPNLTLNSMLHVQSIIKELWFLYEEKGLVPTAPEILEDIRKATWRRANIHHSQRGAIERMTMSSIFSMFDQEGLNTLSPEALITPGTVAILDVSSLTDEQQRTVALYLLSTFGRYKNREQDSNGLLLVMDEAQKLFPQRGDLMREYARRLGHFVSQIVHRGRRRRYGIILSTQYPADVSTEVVDLCDTKFIFRMSGPLSWLRANLGDSNFARRTSELRVGEAFLTSNGLNLPEPVPISFPDIQS